MANILKFPLKKDVFERVKNGEQSEVYFENTDYWSKRFKNTFEKASFTSGKTEALEFDIINIELGKGKVEWGAPEDTDVYIIKLQMDNIGTDNVSEPVDTEEDDEPAESVEDNFEDTAEDPDPAESVDSDDYEDDEPVDLESADLEELLEPVDLDELEDELEEELDEIEDELGQENLTPIEIFKREKESESSNKPSKPVQKQSVTNTKTTEVKKSEVNNPISLENRLNSILEQFCKAEDVITVGTPIVSIQSNGRIIGNKKRLPFKNDVEIRFNVGVEEIIYRDNMDDDSFLDEVKRVLKSKLVGNYVFIWKKKCGIFKYPDGHKFCGLRLTSKMKY